MSTSTRLSSPAICSARQAPRIVTELPLPARLASAPLQLPAKVELLPAKLTAAAVAVAAKPAAAKRAVAVETVRLMTRLQLVLRPSAYAEIAAGVGSISRSFFGIRS